MNQENTAPPFSDNSQMTRLLWAGIRIACLVSWIRISEIGRGMAIRLGF
jgi:hypothetical protein